MVEKDMILFQCAQVADSRDWWEGLGSSNEFSTYFIIFPFIFEGPYVKALGCVMSVFAVFEIIKQIWIKCEKKVAIYCKKEYRKPERLYSEEFKKKLSIFFLKQSNGRLELSNKSMKVKT